MNLHPMKFVSQKLVMFIFVLLSNFKTNEIEITIIKYCFKPWLAEIFSKNKEDIVNILRLFSNKKRKSPTSSSVEIKF